MEILNECDFMLRSRIDECDDKNDETRLDGALMTNSRLLGQLTQATNELNMANALGDAAQIRKSLRKKYTVDEMVAAHASQVMQLAQQHDQPCVQDEVIFESPNVQVVKIRASPQPKLDHPVDMKKKPAQVAESQTAENVPSSVLNILRKENDLLNKQLSESRRFQADSVDINAIDLHIREQNGEIEALREENKELRAQIHTAQMDERIKQKHLVQELREQINQISFERDTQKGLAREYLGFNSTLQKTVQQLEETVKTLKKDGERQALAQERSRDKELLELQKQIQSLQFENDNIRLGRK